jgi:8-oxo-dGTP pyrophosphatase MutT (NUDIX family)
MPRRGGTATQTENVVSAGGLVYRKGKNGLEVVVCGRTEENLWGLPKGTPDKGESIEETAMREVREETGLDVEIESELGSISYWFARPGVRYHKTVYHYLMRPTGGDTSHHDHEYDIVEWIPAEEAVRRLSYANERMMVEKAIGLIGESRQ